MLVDIGVGTPATLTCIHAGQTLEEQFTIEQAPPDMLSTAKCKNVKNVKTFEKLITEAQQAQKTSVRLTVESMGRTRLADLKFDGRGRSRFLESLMPRR